MVVFSSLLAAQTAGYRWYDFSVEEQLHIVETEISRSGRLIKALAFARPGPEDRDEFCASRLMSATLSR